MKKYNVKRTMNTSVLRTPSLVDEFYITTIKSKDKDKKSTVFYSDPIYALFNQQRLNKLGADNIQQWLESMRISGDSSLNQLRSKCSDEQLVQMIRSRHLQSPSEILAWCRYMESNVNEFNAEVQKVIDEQKQQNLVQTEVPEP